MVVVSTIVAIVCAASFALGRWSGELKSSLARESSYPWDLHQLLPSVGFDCKMYQRAVEQHKIIGNYFIFPIEDGTKLFAAHYAPLSGEVTAFLIDGNGRIAYDSWNSKC